MTAVDAPQRIGDRPSGVSLRGVLVSEWIKLWSLRSARVLLAASSAATIGLGLLFAWFAVSGHQLALSDHRTPGGGGGLDPTATSLTGVYLAQLVIGSLGVLVVGSEYRPRSIRTTLTAVPRRRTVVLGKAGVVGAAGATVMVGSTLIAFLGAQRVLAPKHLDITLGAPGVARAVLGGGLYLALVGLFGVALGLIVRNTAGAVAALFVVLLVVPSLARALPSGWGRQTSPFVPGTAGQAVMALDRTAGTLPPWLGLGVFAGYVAVALGVAVVVLERRDA